MKAIALGCLAWVAVAAANASEVVVWKPGIWVDLKQAGALEKLQLEHPMRYDRVMRVLRAAEHPPCDNGEIRILKARHELREMYCGIALLTSLPAKRDVSFVLDDVFYIARVTMPLPGTITRAAQTP